MSEPLCQDIYYLFSTECTATFSGVSFAFYDVHSDVLFLLQEKAIQMSVLSSACCSW